ncbi:MAG: dephospho-CoA kinase [Armatimonadota bacterium]
MIVGLTGGIASGKTLVAEYFRELGVPVIDTDEIARQVVAPGQPAWQRLRAAFGAAYFCPDGTLNRQAMAQRVFNDSQARHLLETLTHPAIFDEVDRQITALHQTPESPRIIVVVVPLLYEVGAADRFDAIIVVHATPEQQRERMQRTRGYTREEADARLAAQLPLANKVARADYVIDNTGDPAGTRAQVVAVLHQLQAE